MRRWNGWAEEGSTAALSREASRLLELEVGPPVVDLPPDATLGEVLAAVPPSRLPADDRLSYDPRGSRPPRPRPEPARLDRAPLRRLGAVPDAVAHPASRRRCRGAARARRGGRRAVIPYGGGTSVVGGVTPAEDDDRPTLTLALDRLAGLSDLDERSGLATFGAGTVGPDLEAALAPHGLTLGHFPQSFERSTLGGWVAARSVGQQSIGFGRIEALFAGGRVVAPAGTLDLPPNPASAAGPDLRQLVLGSEGRLGIITEATVRTVAMPRREAFPAWFLPDWAHAIDAARDVARAGLPLSMLRALDADRDRDDARAGRPIPRRRGRWRGTSGFARLGPERCLVLVGARGRSGSSRRRAGEAGSILRRHGGVAVGGSSGGAGSRTVPRAVPA